MSHPAQVCTHSPKVEHTVERMHYYRAVKRVWQCQIEADSGESFIPGLAMIGPSHLLSGLMCSFASNRVGQIRADAALGSGARQPMKGIRLVGVGSEEVV